MGRTAVLAGATGLVGGEVLRLLLEDPAWTGVVVLARRDLGLTHPKLRAHKVDLDKPDSFESLVKGDDVFCCIGTTMKKAGTEETFYATDFDIPYELARAASKNGAKQYLLVTSSGADANSRFFYPRVKGELEAAVAKVPFESVHILRPSLLLGERSETRPLERLGMHLAPILSLLMLGPLRRYAPIQSSAVARAMLVLAKSASPGVHLHESHTLQPL